MSQPRTGANHHATIARHFLEAYLDDADVLDITELHDEAYNAWVGGARRGDWDKAENRADRLERLGERIGLYLAFYRADNASGDKQAEPLQWCEALVDRHKEGPNVDEPG